MARKRAHRRGKTQAKSATQQPPQMDVEVDECTPQPTRPRRYIAGYVRMPEEPQRASLSMWVYNNRAAIYSTIIAYLIFGILFVGGKITTTIAPRENIIAIDMDEIEKLERERDRLLKEVQQRQQDQQDWHTIANKISNENATDKSSQTTKSTKELIAEGKKSEKMMEANKAALEKGDQAIANMRKAAEARREAEAEAARERQKAKELERKEQRNDAIVKGNVTVVYAFNNPVRHAQYLVVPAYQCEGGGKVTVAVTLTRDGDVSSAKIISGGDDCMRTTAEKAARDSRFDNNQEAPAKQEGYITYLFVPQ